MAAGALEDSAEYGEEGFDHLTSSLHKPHRCIKTSLRVPARATILASRRVLPRPPDLIAGSPAHRLDELRLTCLEAVSRLSRRHFYATMGSQRTVT